MSQHVHVHGQTPDFFVTVYQRMRSWVHEHCRCRECGEYCSFVASVCETCGTQDPVRLPISWGVVFFGICATILAIGAWKIAL
jgi:hypothetical protein